MDSRQQLVAEAVKAFGTAETQRNACWLVDLIDRSALAAVTNAKTRANARRLIVTFQQAFDAFRYLRFPRKNKGVTMKVMVIVKASKGSEAGELPSTELLTAMGRYNEELVNAGIMLAGEGLHPSSKGARVQFSGSHRSVVDGPFAETKELIAGYWLWKVDSMQQAIDWVKRCPNPMTEDSEIEIRRVFEAEDFGEQFTPELREQEASLRAKTLGLNAPNFVDASESTIAGLNQSYTMETRIAIPQQWGRFVPMADEVPSAQGKPFYGISWNTKPDCSFDYLTGFEVTDATNLPGEFSTLKLDARRYAVFSHTGHVSFLPKTIDTIWTKWVPECGLQIAKAPCLELYTAEFDPQTGLGGMEIWIPLESDRVC